MNAGFAQAVITPPVGTWLTGFAAREHASEGVLDELVAQCVVFEDGGRWAAIVRADILCFHPDSVRRIREEIQRLTEIPEEAVLLSGSHTHSGPAVADIEGMGALDRAYQHTMENAVIGAVVSAGRNMTPVETGLGRGALAEVSFIREGRGQGELTRDPDVTVLKIARPDSEETLGMLVNFACHPTVLVADNYLISADYPGRMRRFVESNLGTRALFVQGACGDVNAFWRKCPGGLAACGSAYDEIDRIGRVLGAEALKTSELTPTRPQSGLASLQESVDLPTREPERPMLREMISEADSYLASPEGRTGTHPLRNTHLRYREWASEMLAHLEAGTYPPTLSCPVQILRIGEVLIVGVAAEVFSAVGLAVKEALGRDRTLFVGYANGCVGYVPSSASFDAAGYGARSSAFWYGMPLQAKGSDEALVQGIRRLSRAL